MCFPENDDMKDVNEVSLSAKERHRVSHHDTMFDVFYGDVGDKSRKMSLPMVLGKMPCGRSLVRNLAKLPQLLIAGAAGQGKTVFLHSFICSLIKKKSPNEVRFVLMDSRHVEFNVYARLPHLYIPIVHTAKNGVEALTMIDAEMERRHMMFADAKCREISAWNETNDKVKLPYIVVVIDELLDFMIHAQRRFLALSSRIAALGRAAGIHLVMATSRPAQNVIPGRLKANFPTRLAFPVSCQVDSRTILDADGAESLNGSGDALFRDNTGELFHLQTPYINDKDIERIVAEALNCNLV